MNDIKNYQIEIANFFRNPVDPVNFGVHYYMKDKNNDNLLKLDEKEEIKKLKQIDERRRTQELNTLTTTVNIDDSDDELNFTKLPQEEFELNSKHCLYRMLFMFSDFFWNNNVKVPDEEMFLIFNFLGKHYKVHLGTHYEMLDYFDVNFFKIFYIIADEQMGFIEYVEKNKVFALINPINFIVLFSL